MTTPEIEKKPSAQSGQPSASVSGSGAGAITHIFRTELTRQQAKELKAVWSEHGKDGGMILMQPVINWSVFDLKNCFLQAVVLDDEARKKIFAVIEAAKRQNAADEQQPPFASKP